MSNSELEQLQNEKRKALLEHETAKLRECDEALQRELREWKSQLHPRKQVFTKKNIHIFIYEFFFIIARRRNFIFLAPFELIQYYHENTSVFLLKQQNSL